MNYPTHDLELNSSGICFKDLATLFVWRESGDLYRPQELTLSFVTERVKHEAKTMD